MKRDQEWVKGKLAEIEEKRAMLHALEETLGKWESELDWEQIPPEKQAALLALAGESVETLNVMIKNLGQQIQDRLEELTGGNGERETNE